MPRSHGIAQGHSTEDDILHGHGHHRGTLQKLGLAGLPKGPAGSPKPGQAPPPPPRQRGSRKVSCLACRGPQIAGGARAERFCFELKAWSEPLSDDCT